MRVVLDTNILIAALITRHTPPDRLYQLWLQDAFELITSDYQLDELANVLARPRLQRFITPEQGTRIVDHLDTRAIILQHLPAVNLSPDDEDNPIIAAAITGKADLLVSGDKKHLLALKYANGIPIVTARDALLYIV